MYPFNRLTDEKIKENWIKYNHPDGPQSTSMGIALPKWIVEGKNRIWVLAVYGVIFGGALPALVVCAIDSFPRFVSYTVSSRVAGGSVAAKRPRTGSMLNQQLLSSNLSRKSLRLRKSSGFWARCTNGKFLPRVPNLPRSWILWRTQSKSSLARNGQRFVG